MLKKEKIKLILYITLTIVLITTMIIIAILTRDKTLLKRNNNEVSTTQRELLDVIDHTHTY